MWTVVETKAAQKVIAKLPKEIVQTYNRWLAIVTQLGPAGLRQIKGFHDEALEGKLKGTRSSRLSNQWRVYYTVAADVVTVTVKTLDRHRYRE